LSLLFPSRFQLQKVLKIHIFYWVGLSASQPSPQPEDQGIPFSLGHHLDLSDKGGPTSSHTTDSIALQNHMTTQAPPLCQSRNTFHGRQRGLIKAQNSRMCDEVGRVSYRNERVKKHYTYI